MFILNAAGGSGLACDTILELATASTCKGMAEFNPEQSPSSVLMELSQILSEKAKTLQTSKRSCSLRQKILSSSSATTSATSHSDDEGTCMYV